MMMGTPRSLRPFSPCLEEPQTEGEGEEEGGGGPGGGITKARSKRAKAWSKMMKVMPGGGLVVARLFGGPGSAKVVGERGGEGGRGLRRGGALRRVGSAEVVVL